MERHTVKGLLDRAKVMPGAKYIVFRCSDGYDVGIPLENGMMDGTLLAYAMNLAPLTTAHGFPVRGYCTGIIWNDESKMDNRNRDCRQCL